MQSIPAVDVDAVREQARSFAERELGPFVPARRPVRVDPDLVRKLGSSGLIALHYPANFGGTGRQGAYVRTLCAVREGLAYVSTEASMALALQIGGSHLLMELGDGRLVQELLPAVIAGEVIPAIAVSEPQAGSDVGGVSLVANRRKGGWTLTGEKAWVMNAPDADFYVLLGRTSASESARTGLTTFLVHGNQDGLSGRPVDLLRPHSIGHIYLDNVFVPDEQVLGAVGGGFDSAMRVFDAFRPAVGAYCVGAAEAALDAGIERARTRHAFGKVLGDFQAISHGLAEMATKLQAARLLVYTAAEACDRRDADVREKSAMAKLLASETAQAVVDFAMQVCGAQALETNGLLAHLYDDVRCARIEEGTTEIQLEIIARRLLKRGRTSDVA